MITETFIQNLIVEECCNCGVTFAMTRAYYKQRQADKLNFFCPSGHPQHYSRSTEQRLQSVIDRKNQEIESIHGNLQRQISENVTLEYQRRSEKAKVTKIKNRIANGVCPCCKRTFQNLHRHMTNQHPDFKTKGVK